MRNHANALFPNRSSQDDPAKKSQAALDYQRLMVLFCALIGQIASMGLSFIGTTYNLERDGGAEFSTIGAALAISIVIAMFQLIGWWVLLDTKHYPTGPRKTCGVILTLAFLAFGYGTSSYFNYSSITAPSATIIYRSDQIDERIAILDALRQKADAARQLLPIVRGEKEAGCAAADLEKKTGLYSGSQGTGLVSGALDGICRRATEAEAAITEAVASNAANAARAADIIVQLETALIAVNEPILKRERVITALIRDLDDIIRDVRGARMTDSVEAFFKTLVTSVATLGSPNTATFQGKQNTVLQALRSGFEERLPIIEEVVASVDAIAVPGALIDNRPSVHELMLYSVRQHPQNVLLAAGLDSFVAFMILALLVKSPLAAPTASHIRPSNT